MRNNIKKCTVAACIIVFFILSLLLIVQYRKKTPKQEASTEEFAKDESFEIPTEQISNIKNAIQESGKSKHKLPTDADIQESSEQSPTKTVNGLTAEEKETVMESKIEVSSAQDVGVSEASDIDTIATDDYRNDEETDSEDLNTSETVQTGENGVYGDTGERIFYRCDKEKFWYLILKLGDPQWYRSGESQEYYEKVFALSKRYTTEHPFSEGSILKPYFQNIEYVFPFVSDYETREVVVKAYDISGTKKYFLIEFTITDNYELDTVSIRELADDEVGE